MTQIVPLIVALFAKFYPAIAPLFYLGYVIASGQNAELGTAITAVLVALGLSHQVASNAQK